MGRALTSTGRGPGGGALAGVRTEAAALLSLPCPNRYLRRLRLNVTADTGRPAAQFSEVAAYLS